jgi:hypothetical protein
MQKSQALLTKMAISMERLWIYNSTVTDQTPIVCVTKVMLGP